jgi:hypothetical protein
MAFVQLLVPANLNRVPEKPILFSPQALRTPLMHPSIYRDRNSGFSCSATRAAQLRLEIIVFLAGPALRMPLIHPSNLHG